MTPQHDLGNRASDCSQRDDDVRLRTQLFRALLDTWSLLRQSRRCLSSERDLLLLRIELRLCFLLEMHCTQLLSASELVSILSRSQQLRRALSPDQDPALTPSQSPFRQTIP